MQVRSPMPQREVDPHEVLRDLHEQINDATTPPSELSPGPGGAAEDAQVDVDMKS